MQQRLADLRTEFDMARELADELKAECKSRWQEFKTCRDEFRSLRALCFSDDDRDARLIGQAVMVARARMEATEQPWHRASARLVWAERRCSALRATLRAAEYLAEQKVAQR